MANNLIQIKRTSVSGRAANTTTLANPGELALNMTDGIMYSTNGSTVFEVGANLTSIAVGNSTSRFVANTTRVAIGTSQGLLANGSIGTSGQILTSNGTTVYWSSPSTGVNAQQTTYTYTLAANTTLIQGADDSAATLSYTTGLESVFINGVRQISGVDYNATNATAITLTANAVTGEVVQVVTWTGQVNTTNVDAQFAWTNTHTFSNTVSLNGGLSANGSIGTPYQVLLSNGTKAYWENQLLRTSGQQVISSSGTLNSSNYGTNILVVTGGITITLPSSSGIPSGMGITIKNISGANITISYAYAGDGQTNLQNNQAASWFSDGGSSTFWRQYFLSTNA